MDPGLSKSEAMPSSPPTRALSALTGAAGVGAFGLWYQLFRRPLPQHQRPHAAARAGGAGRRGAGSLRRSPHPLARRDSTSPSASASATARTASGSSSSSAARRPGACASSPGRTMLHVDRLMRTLGLYRTAQREATELDAAVRTRLTPMRPASTRRSRTRARFRSSSRSCASSRSPGRWRTCSPPRSCLRSASPPTGRWSSSALSWFATRERRRPHAWSRSTRAPTRSSSRRGRPTAGDGVDIAEQIARVKEQIGLTTQAGGSNNWVVSGERSVTGRPLLACDPHLSTTIPGLWYEADLGCDEYRVRGATLPHSPDPVYGQTRHAAWGFTNVMADIQDLYVERFNPDDDRLYEFEGDWRRAEVVREEIRVKGRSKPEVLDVKITHHGPIVNEALGAADEQPLALSWTALQYPLLSDASHTASRRLAAAEELVAATAEHTAPPLNMLWADSAGNIGYKLIGRLPVRRGGCPDLPKPGLDRRVRVGRHRPLRGASRGRQPGERVPRHGQQPHRRRRLPAPHHLRVDDRLPRPAHRGAARRARAPLARGLRAPSARRLLLPGRGDGPPAVAAAPEDAAGDAGDRVAQELGRTARRRDRRRHDLPRLHARASHALVVAAIGDPHLRRALPQQVGGRADPRRVVSLALPGAPARALGRGRPLLVRLRGPSERAGPGTTSRSRRSGRARHARAPLRSRSRTAGAGARCTGSSSPTRSASANAVFERIFNRRAKPAAPARPCFRAATCR